jgi:hypothetical protein
MRNTFDFAPLFRSTIGFDRMLDTLESASRVASIDTWPPYDIVRTSEDDYRISMAKRELPEEMKPRRIAIATSEALPKAGKKQIEAEKQAA